MYLARAFLSLVHASGTHGVVSSTVPFLPVSHPTTKQHTDVAITGSDVGKLRTTAAFSELLLRNTATLVLMGPASRPGRL